MNEHLLSERQIMFQRQYDYSVSVSESCLKQAVGLIKEGKDIDFLTSKNIFTEHLLRNIPNENRNVFQLLMDNEQFENSLSTFESFLSKCYIKNIGTPYQPTSSITFEEFSKMTEYALKNCKQPEAFLSKIFEYGGTPNCYYCFENSQNPNVDIYGSALHHAIADKNISADTVLCLLKNGAITVLKSDYNKTAFDYLSFDKSDSKFSKVFDYVKGLPANSVIKQSLYQSCVNNKHFELSKEIQDSGLVLSKNKNIFPGYII